MARFVPTLDSRDPARDIEPPIEVDLDLDWNAVLGCNPPENRTAIGRQAVIQTGGSTLATTPPRMAIATPARGTDRATEGLGSRSHKPGAVRVRPHFRRSE